VVGYKEKGAAILKRLGKSLEKEDLEDVKLLIEELEIVCPVSGSKNWTEVKQFNLMFGTKLGASAESATELYLRPETAQGIFVNFLNVQKTGRMKLPFGIAQTGKAFRNEIVARQFIFRMREFEQMEMQFFIPPGTQKEWYARWKEARLKWHHSLGLGELPDSFASVVSRDRETDTVYYWYKGIEADSLKFTLKHDTLTKSYEYRIRKAEPDSLKVTVVQNGTLQLVDTLKIRTNTPLKDFDVDAISLLDKDSVSVPFKLAQNNKHELQMLFDVFPNENYQLQLLPGAITDFFDVTHDTLAVKLNTKSRVDYGNLSLRLGNVPSFPIFIDLLDEKEEIKRSVYATEPRGVFRFAYLRPNKYYIRVRIDENANGKWDTGHYLKKQKPEAVYHFESQLEVRANWELQEQFILK
jgi:hypothetical protein